MAHAAIRNGGSQFTTRVFMLYQYSICRQGLVRQAPSIRSTPSWYTGEAPAADALGWKYLRPILDELLVGPANRTDVAIEVIQSDGIEAAVLLRGARCPNPLDRLMNTR